jgi:hypothetical protein
MEAVFRALWFSTNSFTIKTAIKIIATTILKRPKRRMSGTRMNSMMFIIATIAICISVHQRDFMPLKTQMAISISKAPMAFVKSDSVLHPIYGQQFAGGGEQDSGFCRTGH